MSGEITVLLDRWRQGDETALEVLMPLVYEELRRIASAYLSREREGHTLQPTALVHEAYLRLVGLHSADFRNRTHFYGAAARSMRRILVDHARRHRTAKRGEAWRRLSLDEVAQIGFSAPGDLLDLDEALTRLSGVSEGGARVVELRCFAGLSIDETAACLDIAPATVKRRWTFARAWLARALAS
jgi:RNA polymerase sigma factor (TIGR02999 family)